MQLKNRLLTLPRDIEKKQRKTLILHVEIMG